MSTPETIRWSQEVEARLEETPLICLAQVNYHSGLQKVIGQIDERLQSGSLQAGEHQEYERSRVELAAFYESRMGIAPELADTFRQKAEALVQARQAA